MPVLRIRPGRPPIQATGATPTTDGDITFDSGCIVDIIVDGQIILELKAVDRILPIHEAQLLTDLRLTQCRVGRLINFNTVSLADGIRRRVV